MKKLRVGINGFGRIGRMLLREGWEQLEFVGINSLDSISGAAHLLKYDSTHGIFPPEVTHTETQIVVAGQKLNFSQFKNPAQIPWKDWGVDLVLECTGAFKKREEFAAHLQAGASRVLVSAPADGVDTTLVVGVNHESFQPEKHQIVSNASCTTNCLAPLAKVIHQSFGIENGTMLTVHSYTNDQQILDAPHKDLRRARAAALSMIPTTTGAAKAVGLVLPELKGKIDGIAVRVPTPNVSLVDFTFNTQRDLTKQSLLNALTAAASAGPLKGVLAVEEKELVSVDFNGNPHSCIVDLASTITMGPRTAKVLAWYDNEVGFSNRMVDLAKYMASRG